MKALLSALLFFVSSQLLLGQATSALYEDPAFVQTLGRIIRYPKAAQKVNQVAKVYVEFKVNKQSSITGVQLLNPKNVDTAFQEEVNRFMAQLPKQNPAYAGTYVLPITFELEGTNQTLKPLDEKTAFLTSLNKVSLLKEIVVVGYIL